MKNEKAMEVKSFQITEQVLIRTSLCEETLTDGSKAYNVYMLLPDGKEITYYAVKLLDAINVYAELNEVLDKFVTI